MDINKLISSKLISPITGLYKSPKYLAKYLAYYKFSISDDLYKEHVGN